MTGRIRQKASGLINVKKGFTLIELLVVVTIIVMLVALLVPAMDRALTAAEKAVCASRLHGWVSGLNQYYMDNNRKFMRMNTYGQAPENGNLVTPSGIQTLDTQLTYGTLHIKRIGSYLGGEITQDNYTDGLLYCPSEDPAWARAMIDPTYGPQWTSLGAIHMGYAVFTRVGEWEASDDLKGLAQKQLMDRTPAANRLLVMDDFFTNSPAVSGWKINHGKEGSRHWAPGPITLDPRELDGVNQAFGDGGVHWKSGDRFDMDSLAGGSPTTTYTGGWLLHSGSGVTAF